MNNNKCVICGAMIDDFSVKYGNNQCHECYKLAGARIASKEIINGESERTLRENCIVCPYCGALDNNDLWELDETGEMDCCECGKTFIYETNTIITYSTERKED